MIEKFGALFPAGRFCGIGLAAYSSRRASMGWRREAREAGA